VFLVLYAIRIFVFLNNPVIILVSFPTYVNFAQFCFCVVWSVIFLFSSVFIFRYDCDE
jgi:hypothetical protein